MKNLTLEHGSLDVFPESLPSWDVRLMKAQGRVGWFRRPAPVEEVGSTLEVPS